ERAKMLIHLSKESGADAAKFQNFKAQKIVSDYGFTHMERQLSHQASWEKSVYEVYEDAATPLDWTPILKEECDKVGIDYFSTPYDLEAVDYLEPYVPAYKVGSGDIDWLESLEKIAGKGKPVILSTGASTIGEVQQAVQVVLAINNQLVLMQCNTNYTGSVENFPHIHLNVITTYAQQFPNVVVGLSDHTPGHATCLGAVSLGARMIEKHFTDDQTRDGPDHPYAMTPKGFYEMVNRTRELELALGSHEKYVAENEQDTVIVQRRCLRAARDIAKEEVLVRDLIDVLRPVAPDAILPCELGKVIGMKASKPIPAGSELRWDVLVK
ncbi:MAG: N-acetylneuraminate synthase family protein, partial [Desulfobacteraceae bacterium]|nr:N-acetylneuraminate synthase family protein [Desulfobacteraceae bacterium]